MAIKQFDTTSSTTTSSSQQSFRCTSPRLVHRNEHQIRQRLLHRLGITATQRSSIRLEQAAGRLRKVSKTAAANAAAAAAASGQASQHEKSKLPQQQEQPTLESSFSSSCDTPLQLQQHQSPQSPIIHSHPQETPKSCRVQWSATAEMREIPSHRDYDSETRDQLWNSLKQIERNARRNRMEYLADGCQWQKATEEDRFVQWSETGELVHPATYWVLYEQEQERLLLQEQQHQHHSSLAVHVQYCNDKSGFATTVGIKKSPTMTSLAGLAA